MALGLGCWRTGSWSRSRPFGASRLGVRLVESGPEESPRWAGSGEPEPPKAPGPGRLPGGAGVPAVVGGQPLGLPPRRARTGRGGGPTPGPSAGPIPGGGPTSIGPPRPRLLIGSGLTPWPGPVGRPRGVVPGLRLQSPRNRHPIASIATAGGSTTCWPTTGRRRPATARGPADVAERARAGPTSPEIQARAKRSAQAQSRRRPRPTP